MDQGPECNASVRHEDHCTMSHEYLGAEVKQAEEQASWDGGICQDKS